MKDQLECTTDQLIENKMILRQLQRSLTSREAYLAHPEIRNFEFVSFVFLFFFSFYNNVIRYK